MDDTYQYLKSIDVYMCMENEQYWWGNYGWNVYGAGYVLNHPTRTGTIYEGVSLAQVESPTRCSMVADLHPAATSPAVWPTHWTPSSSYFGTYAPIVHNNGANIGFIDGHVEWYRSPTYSSLPVYYYNN
jgi:prepilin-type processing-associated H-X9-DG protein